MGQDGKLPCMSFQIVVVEPVWLVLEDLERRDRRKALKVTKALDILATNLRHPGLQSHPFITMRGPAGETVWESYVENRTPGAWRVWWFYGPDEGMITVVEIGPHK